MLFFSKLAEVYLLDNTKPWFGFVNRDPIYKVTGKYILMDFT